MPAAITGRSGWPASQGPISCSKTCSKPPAGTFRMPEGALFVSSTPPSLPSR
jgi:hypothetical protein